VRAWLRDRPWIWIVVFLVLMAAANLVLVVVALLDPPVPV
jgi:hypothetical protein